MVFTIPPGKSIKHEITEAYEGAKISQGTGVSSKNSNFINSVYQQAHNLATPQNPIYRRYYDKGGRVSENIQNAVKVEYYVKKDGVEKTIQTGKP